MIDSTVLILSLLRASNSMETEVTPSVPKRMYLDAFGYVDKCESRQSQDILFGMEGVACYENQWDYFPELLICLLKNQLST
jgi:hypothetical protein